MITISKTDYDAMLFQLHEIKKTAKREEYDEDILTRVNGFTDDHLEECTMTLRTMMDHCFLTVKNGDILGVDIKDIHDDVSIMDCLFAELKRVKDRIQEDYINKMSQALEDRGVNSLDL